MVSTRYSLNAFVGHSVADKLSEPTSTALREGILLLSEMKSTQLDPPLVRDPRSQTQFLARHLCRSLLKCGLSAARAAMHHRHQLRLGTCPEAFTQRSLSLSSAEGVAGPVGTLMRTVFFRHRPAWLLQRDLGFRTQRVPLPVPLARPLLLSSD